jgi:hypothetical protein
VNEISTGSRWRSSRTRAILLTLSIFLISIWSIAGYSNFVSREEIHLLVSDQQSATASYIAGAIGAEFKQRKVALELIASGIDAILLGKPASVQNYLQQRPILEVLFNTGVFVTRLDGTAIAEVPLIGRVGLNYMDRDHIAAALLRGEAIVGRPFLKP